MNHFPLFLNLNDKKVLIVGGGNIANRKLKYLLDFTSKTNTIIKLISKEFNSDILDTIKKNNLKIKTRDYKQKDIKKFDIVIVAINDKLLQKDIFEESKKYGKCLVNSVDNKKYCDFILPSYTKTGDLTIAISTNGTSPAFAKQFLEIIKRIIPNDIDKFLENMNRLRYAMPKGKNRMNFFSKKVKKYINNSS